MNLATSRTVRDLALEIPGATRVFEKMGIDFCCGGKRSLADACTMAGVRFEDVQQSLEISTASPVAGKEPDFNAATLEELTIMSCDNTTVLPVSRSLG